MNYYGLTFFYTTPSSLLNKMQGNGKRVKVLHYLSYYYLSIDGSIICLVRTRLTSANIAKEILRLTHYGKVNL